ncbi:MAG TPA: aminoglycoside phosphotransferase family protein [Pirellulales bacterium]|jgi:hypothetical protein|nr:aminoglycoside phosphotransferase family protein [Pirellulales bacterium]
MQLLDEHNVGDYLRATGQIAPTEIVHVSELSGGVSNAVYYVAREPGAGCDFVLKQARAQLRTSAAWFCAVERIWREVAVLRACQRILAAALPARGAPLLPSADSVGAPEPHGLHATTPEVLYEDRANYCFAMTAAPAQHHVWKRDLLAGRLDPHVAAACGQLLGRLHAESWLDGQLAAELGDRQWFEELRIDPYYRTVATVQPDLAPAIQRLIDSIWQQGGCLVHADFSPKNLLVFDGGLMMVDFETGHFGDPAFDLGFFLSHLLLKSAARPQQAEAFFQLTEQFMLAYRQQVEPILPAGAWLALEARLVQNFAGCALARLDGKSRIDYLPDQTSREGVRRWCRFCFAERPTLWGEVLAFGSAFAQRAKTQTKVKRS